MDFNIQKKVNTFFIFLVLASLFSITYYMDTHDGRTPWDRGEVFVRKIETSRYSPRNTEYSHARRYRNVASNTRRDPRYTDSQYKREIPPSALYVSSLHREISHEWQEFNRRTSDIAKDNVIIRIVIDKDGEILSSYIHKPSLSYEYNNLALEFVKNLAPFRPLPSNIEDSTVNVSLSFGKNSFGTSKF